MRVDVIVGRGSFQMILINSVIAVKKWLYSCSTSMMKSSKLKLFELTNERMPEIEQ